MIFMLLEDNLKRFNHIWDGDTYKLYNIFTEQPYNFQILCSKKLKLPFYCSDSALFGRLKTKARFSGLKLLLHSCLISSQLVCFNLRLPYSVLCAYLASLFQNLSMVLFAI